MEKMEINEPAEWKDKMQEVVASLEDDGGLTLEQRVKNIEAKLGLLKPTKAKSFFIKLPCLGTDDMQLKCKLRRDAFGKVIFNSKTFIDGNLIEVNNSASRSYDAVGNDGESLFIPSKYCGDCKRVHLFNRFYPFAFRKFSADTE